MALILTFATLLCVSHICYGAPDEGITNDTDNKDVYVIHAMVYQVGILTNSTDDEDTNSSLAGNQESLTFFHKNGSQIDLSKIPEPLLTNVTGQSFVGVAPVIANNMITSEDGEKYRQSRGINEYPPEDYSSESEDVENANILDYPISKRSITGTDTVKILNGSSMIPQEAAVQSLSLPPLVTLNNHLSEIPVPIPNTSVLQYAKINTLVKKSNGTE